MIGVFKKNISYQSGCIIYNIYSGEHREYEFLKQHIPNHVLECYIKDGIIELYPALTKEEPVVENTVENEVDLKPIQEIEETTFEIVYKTTDSIQDKDGNEIEIDTRLTKEELKEKGFTKKKIQELVKEEKLMEIKVVK